MRRIIPMPEAAEAVVRALARRMTPAEAYEQPSRVWVGNEMVYVRVDDAWAAIVPAQPPPVPGVNLAGYVGGFNFGVVDAARAMAALRLVRLDEADAFVAWFRAEENATHEAAKEAEVRKWAKVHDFVLRRP